MELTRINEFQAAQGKADELLGFLNSLSGYISSSKGCSGCEILQNSDDSNIIVVIERWDSKESHQQSLDNYPKEKMAEAMPLIGAPPKGQFYYYP